MKNRKTTWVLDLRRMALVSHERTGGGFSYIAVCRGGGAKLTAQNNVNFHIYCFAGGFVVGKPGQRAQNLI